jgi:hypothetical protein
LPDLAPGDTAVVGWTIRALAKPGAVAPDQWPTIFILQARSENGVSTNEIGAVQVDLAGSNASVPPNVVDNRLTLVVGPNPAGRDLTIRLVLPSGGETRVEIFDLFGRRQATVFAGSLAAGSHTLQWGPASSGAQALQPGLYLLRVSHGPNSVTRRFVIAR